MAEGAVREERRMALHDLLDRPVVSRAAHPEAYRRVYLHETHLRSWLWDRPRWRLLAGQGTYRLERLPSQVQPERGLPRLRAPLDYACLCWALWFAETRAAQPQRWFVLSDLAAEVARVAAGSFALGERTHRESLARALQLLVDLGVLVHRDGEAERWVAGQGEVGAAAEVLYEFAEDAPRLLAAFDPTWLDALGEGPDDGPALPRTGEAAAPEARAWRALLLGPGLWRRDDPEAHAALLAAADRFHRDLDEALGWQLEAGEEYARIWRTTTARLASGALLDLLPEPGEAPADRHVKYVFHPILLLVSALRAAAAEGRVTPEADGTLALSAGSLRDLLLDLYRSHRRDWGAELGEQAAFEEVVARVLRQMRQMGYLRGPDGIGRCWLTPVAGRLAGAYPGQPALQGAGAGPADGRPGGGGPAQGGAVRQGSLWDGGAGGAWPS
jgi:uncharacterized protein (TIGR02678 family)